MNSQNKIKPKALFLILPWLLISTASSVAANDAKETLFNAIDYEPANSGSNPRKETTTQTHDLNLAKAQLNQQKADALNAVIAQLGHWPGIDDVGENAAKIAVVLFKQANPTEQKRYLPLMKQAVATQQIPAVWYTEATDYHLMQQNLPQKFGHLLAKNADGIETLYPYKSLQKLAQNRQEFGLPPLKQTLGEKNRLMRHSLSTPGEVELNDINSLMNISELALKCLNQIYPNSVKHVLNSKNDAQAPDQLYPVFYGCFDWHSAVHGHWLLIRVAKLFPNHPRSAVIMERLAAQFTPQKLEAELAYFKQSGRAGFERPYGLAWFLQLYAELHDWQNPQAQAWLKHLTPLKNHIVTQLATWIPKLAYPIRTGEHSQTAFAFGLALDYANQTGDSAFSDLLIKHSKRLYLKDTQCPIHYEPSGQDFLSACLAEADLMRRMMSKQEYATWLKRFLPRINKGHKWLPVAQVTDRVDGKLAHLDGLNLARAWMLEGIASGLPQQDKRRKTLSKLAQKHAESGLSAVTGEHYAGGHWLGSFATYYLTQRGIDSSQ